VLKQNPLYFKKASKNLNNIKKISHGRILPVKMKEKIKANIIINVAISYTLIIIKVFEIERSTTTRRRYGKIKKDTLFISN
jgi:hypothetical protein